VTERKAEIRRLVKETSSLPTLPGIITRLSSLSESNKAGVREMARIVSSDQVLSARVLRLVNSPSYGFYRVSTISNAMILLGVDVIKSLALSSSIFEIMEEHVVGLWEHSLGCGVAANIIARRLNIPEIEEISTAGLLHDIGKVIIKIRFEEEYEQLYTVMSDKKITMLEAERELMETDHAEVGEILARSWNLPDKLVEPVACHHEPERSSLHLQKTAVVHLADIMVKAAGFGFSGDEFVPQISPVVWDKLGLNEQLLGEIAEELEERLFEVKNFSLEIQSADGA